MSNFISSTLIDSLLQDLSQLQPTSTSSSSVRNNTSKAKADDHISDSEASSPSSPSPSSSADEPGDTTGDGTGSHPSNPLTPFLSNSRTKPLLATLHVLFPHHLLPALDVLDRRLVTRLRVAGPPPPDSGPGSGPGPGPASASERDAIVVYYVRSLGSTVPNKPSTGESEAASGPERGHGLGYGLGYEVRLTAWHCTCAAFAFGAAESDSRRSTGLEEGEDEDEDEDEAAGKHSFGGLYRSATATAAAAAATPPVCKHLLACLLAEMWMPLRATIYERDVSRGELAGWTAGWV